MSDENKTHYSSCDVCRARKFKCNKEKPSCRLCLQQGFGCVYSPKTSRTALTRQNLTEAEDRVKNLELAFAALLPNVDLDAVLKSIRPDSASGDQQGPVENADVEASKKKPVRTGNSSPGSDSRLEALPLEADGFDWAENVVSFDELSDGMAALSIKPEGAGYLGATSSVVPLRALLNSDRSNDQASPPPDGWTSQNPLQSSILSSIPLSNLSEITLIDAYFMYYHTNYPFLHEPTFRAQFHGTTPRPRGNSWPILLNTVLALGAWSIGDDNSTIDDVFYQQVVQVTRDKSVFEFGNLALVQALLLLSNYTQKRNRPNTGWNYLGLAVRMALSLGLHKEFPHWKITLLQREMRRRVWWGVYIFDSGASTTFGRPVLLPDDGIMDACQVLNIPEDSLTTMSTTLPVETELPTVYSGLIAQSRFHSKTNSLYHRLISSPEPSAAELLDLEKTIDTWEEQIPGYFQVGSPAISSHEGFLLSRNRLDWRNWNLRIVMFRPIILRWAGKRRNMVANSLSSDYETAEEHKCRQHCLESARQTIDSISNFINNNIFSRLGTWYMLFFLFQASLIPLILLTTDPTHADAHLWLRDIQTTQNILRYTSIANNQLAARCLEILDRLCSPNVEPNVILQDAILFDSTQSFHNGEQYSTMDFWDWSNMALQEGI